MKLKKVLVLCCASLMLFNLTACNKGDTEEKETEVIEETVVEEANKQLYNDGNLEVVEADYNVIKAIGTDAGEWANGEYPEEFVTVESKDNTITITAKAAGAGTVSVNGAVDSDNLNYAIDFSVDENNNILAAVRIIDLEAESLEEYENLTETELMVESIYAQIPEDSHPLVESKEISISNKEEMLYNFGVEELAGLESGTISDPMMTSVAYSLSVLKFDTNENALKAVATLEENAPTNKWVCVMADKVLAKVVNENYVIFAMTSAETIDLIDTVEIE